MTLLKEMVDKFELRREEDQYQNVDYVCPYCDADQVTDPVFGEKHVPHDPNCLYLRTLTFLGLPLPKMTKTAARKIDGAIYPVSYEELGGRYLVRAKGIEAVGIAYTKRAAVHDLMSVLSAKAGGREVPIGNRVNWTFIVAQDKESPVAIQSFTYERVEDERRDGI